MERRRRRWRTRYGFTLIETVVALIILGVALLGLALFVSRMAHAGTDSNLLGTANELAADRLEIIKSHLTYSTIDAYAGTESSIAGLGNAGFVRQTIIKHVGGGTSDSVDYRVVTVVVTNSAMPDTVRKTTVIAAF
ncbi:MAG: prepilin-type N-terminal cleavage/methylation domain-containing protein [Gemmatimonadota bacterium]|nr:prepilin-type N-terminal cleavage/methylation domain-containing protein [Gemmatimonadota bacterium]MDE3126739.1 prepilin-type N-terminal cleavage/methylation domain-containing protein [Gemmatimonadota bacterium]MDE3215021.1 prepilin-type N-terminal cleavage/methylation domain-containing protein [Gemmatimonadota bacterium]